MHLLNRRFHGDEKGGVSQGKSGRLSAHFRNESPAERIARRKMRKRRKKWLSGIVLKASIIKSSLPFRDLLQRAEPLQCAVSKSGYIFMVRILPAYKPHISMKIHVHVRICFGTRENLRFFAVRCG